MTFLEEMEEMESAEDFMVYFGLEYDATVVHVNRLHILQRFHDYLSQASDNMPDDEDALREIYKKLLQRAYSDFVESDAQTEKVFKVFKMMEPQTVFVSLGDIKT
ncbi:nitrogenase-stabilizing/protective protein NifW [Methylomonas sp. EFPC3]|uniref:nitrogenase-stabilizing/protective protein NifW n=1 Tax=Methylomonas TaxID=416 RepID=UPI0011298D3B|nr:MULTISPECIES: nitrogenase-stabilizing/protective protein NifW [Methylomonas]TPQ27896.1 nitrogen fixation protein NifW [Methylomonas koyamae]WFP50119.1 nitrogenase-stabilizing/protective protein NifW [Methylomonas sp. EFPC3]